MMTCFVFIGLFECDHNKRSVTIFILTLLGHLTECNWKSWQYFLLESITHYPSWMASNLWCMVMVDGGRLSGPFITSGGCQQQWHGLHISGHSFHGSHFNYINTNCAPLQSSESSSINTHNIKWISISVTWFSSNCPFLASFLSMLTWVQFSYCQELLQKLVKFSFTVEVELGRVVFIFVHYHLSSILGSLHYLL